MRIEDILLLGVAVISAVCLCIDFSKQRHGNARIVLGLVVLLACFVGYLYFPLATDYWAYKITYFDYASDNFDFPPLKDARRDFGFLWLCILIKSLGGYFDFFYLVICCVSLYLCYNSIMKYTVFPFAAWFLMFTRTFYERNINQIRQGLAISILFFALRYVEERKPYHFVFFIMLASLVHKTMLAALVIYPLSYIRWDAKKILLFVCFTAGLYYINLYRYLLYIPAQYFGIGVAKLSAYNIDYMMLDSVSSAYHGFNKHTEVLETSYLIYRSALILFLSFYLLKWKNISYNNLNITMLLLGFSCMVIFSELSIFSARLSGAFTTVFCLALPEIYREADTISKKLVFSGIIVLIGMFFFFRNHFWSVL